VDTAVAMAFGASVQPLTKMTPITRMMVTIKARFIMSPAFRLIKYSLTNFMITHSSGDVCKRSAKNLQKSVVLTM